MVDICRHLESEGRKEKHRMPCQIGISMSPEQRKTQWEQERPTLRNWQILEVCDRKSEAQRRERELARQYGCHHHQGGSGPEYTTWYVYYFQY